MSRRTPLRVELLHICHVDSSRLLFSPGAQAAKSACPPKAVARGAIAMSRPPLKWGCGMAGQEVTMKHAGEGVNLKHHHLADNIVKLVQIALPPVLIFV